MAGVIERARGVRNERRLDPAAPQRLRDQQAAAAKHKYGLRVCDERGRCP
jgi:hypothetical protein